MDNRVSRLIDLVKKLHEDCLDDAIDYMQEKLKKISGDKPIPPCPHCKSESVTRFGQKHGRLRYRCKDCGKTFVETTNTIMYHSHSREAVWRQVASDTLDGVPIDQTAASVGVSHATAFRMRHKILLTFESDESRTPTVLGGVCELDDTYVLESHKGTEIPESYWRKARKHGATAQKRGISNEYVCISTGVERDGSAISRTATRSVPSKEDMVEVFSGHIEQESLILCDGCTSYNALGEDCKCTVKNVYEETDVPKGGKGFFNINTANSFHSFIKARYVQFRGVATKYLNRYNALFSKTFRCGSNLADEVFNDMISNDVQRWHSVNDVKTLNLLNI